MVSARPARYSATLVNFPLTGAESVIPAGTYRTDPRAQFGTQLSMPDLPSPVASLAVHVVHRIAVTTLPPSALKSISAGLRPVNCPMATSGTAAAGDDKANGDPDRATDGRPPDRGDTAAGDTVDADAVTATSASADTPVHSTARLLPAQFRSVARSVFPSVLLFLMTFIWPPPPKRVATRIRTVSNQLLSNR
jgi:hypothetical protein